MTDFINLIVKTDATVSFQGRGIQLGIKMTLVDEQLMLVSSIIFWPQNGVDDQTRALRTCLKDTKQKGVSDIQDTGI